MKLLNSKTLAELNNKAIKAGFNKVLEPKMVAARVDPKGVHIVRSSFAHGDADCLRCTMLVKVTGKSEPIEVMLDMDLDDYAKLSDIPKEALIQAGY